MQVKRRITIILGVWFKEFFGPKSFSFPKLGVKHDLQGRTCLKKICKIRLTWALMSHRLCDKVNASCSTSCKVGKQHFISSLVVGRDKGICKPSCTASATLSLAAAEKWPQTYVFISYRKRQSTVSLPGSYPPSFSISDTILLCVQDTTWPLPTSSV